MHVTTAQLPEPPAGEDRIFVTDNAVIMLDGASAFSRRDVSAATYAEHLGSHVAKSLDEAPDADLVIVLSDAIAATADALDLSPGGGAPSSTVAICRAGSDSSVDLLVLGDTQIALPASILRDDRLGGIGTEQQRAYRSRLRAGHGYDQQHRALLRAVQDEQLRHRNREGGYWIAEADPKAARHALTDRVPAIHLPWCVLATDGAYRSMELNEEPDWATVACHNGVELQRILDRCHGWEESTDPGGQFLPRAKRHDDKSLAAVTF